MAPLADQKRTPMNSYDPIKKRVESIAQVTSRHMFGYLCFSINKKFFVGFSSKNNQQVIVKLPKDQQEAAIKTKAVKPFHHGARAGWIEIDSKLTTTAGAIKWIRKGYENAIKLSA